MDKRLDIVLGNGLWGIAHGSGEKTEIKFVSFILLENPVEVGQPVPQEKYEDMPRVTVWCASLDSALVLKDYVDKMVDELRRCEKQEKP